MNRLRKTSEGTDNPRKAMTVRNQRIFYGAIAILGIVALVIVVRTWVFQPSTVVSQSQTQSTEEQAPSSAAAVPAAALTAQDVQRITLADAKSLLDNGTAVLIDARSERAYSSGHAAGAISLPEAEVVARLSELPTDKSLIFYCT